MEDKEIQSEFKFIGNRVASLNLVTRNINTKGQRVGISFNFDYNVKDIRQSDDKVLGVIEFMVKARAMVKRRLLFKVELVMEGAFTAERELLPDEVFFEMLELNGLITLSQLSRAYIISVTSQSGINPPVTIPMIDVMKLREMKKNQSD